MSDLKQFEEYRKTMKFIKIRNRVILSVLAAAMTALWIFGGLGMSAEERSLWKSVRTAQNLLWENELRSGRGDTLTDPNKTGLIGVEWSVLSTTLGSLPAKRSASDPRFAILTYRWLGKLDIKRGDKVLLLSSSSFPGMILNVVKALEARGADVTMVLSLGSSTYGANVPGSMWPDKARILREKGLLHTKPSYFTYGGDWETGGGISEEGIKIMKETAERENVPIIVGKSLEDMINWKMSLIKKGEPKVVINIGGSHANMGNGEDILRLPPGLIRSGKGGDGVIGRTLDLGIPVIHMLNIKSLAAAEGIPFDGSHNMLFKGGRSVVLALCAAALFICSALLFRRWHMI